jgi:uncharacterized protein YjgD (DUF1641 family)
MAQPIPFESRKRDFREELRVRLEQAPADHAEAMLAGYEVLQQLHDKGVLEVMRGMLGGSDRILEVAVDAIKTEDSIRILRSLLIMLKLAGSVDPNQLHGALDAGDGHAPSLWEIGKRARTDDVRRGMAAAVTLLGIFGTVLKKEQAVGPH